MEIFRNATWYQVDKKYKQNGEVLMLNWFVYQLKSLKESFIPPWKGIETFQDMSYKKNDKHGRR